MASVEEEVLSDGDTRPFMYCRYIDDILTDVRDDDSLDRLRTRIQEISGLQFTIEHSVQNRICFLDIDIDASGDIHRTKVHRKTTDLGKCIANAPIGISAA